MRCVECGNETRRELRDHRYTESGLQNLTLVDVSIDVCTNCRQEYITIPALGQLHRLLAQELIESGAQLTGDEIRFLRKHLGWGPDDFAKFLSVEIATIDSWEEGSASMSGVQEQALRLAVASGMRKTSYTPAMPQHAPVKDRRVKREPSRPWHFEQRASV